MFTRSPPLARVTPAQLETYLHTHIPLSAAMAVRVLEVTPESVRLKAPLAPNLNHRGTAFGGSAAALAILSGWALAHVRLAAQGFTGRLVLQREQVAYTRPITGSFEAHCTAPPPEAWADFDALLARRGRARIVLEATLYAAGEPCATFTGAYVALTA